MFCQQCGISIADNAKFCPNCGLGTQINQTPQPTKSQNPQAKKPFLNRPAIVVLTLITLAIVAAIAPWKPAILKDFEISQRYYASSPMGSVWSFDEYYYRAISPAMVETYGSDWEGSLKDAQKNAPILQIAILSGIIGLGALAFITIGKPKRIYD